MSQEQLKQQAARAALEYVKDDMVVGIGTGSTVNYFIELLATVKGKIQGTVASSKASEERLRLLNIPVYDLNSVNSVDVYIDGADEITQNLHCIKGGGGALTGEKIIAQVAKQFICIADESKLVGVLGAYPLPVEVIPMARSYLARQLVKMGGEPLYREGFISDYGNMILDVHNLDVMEPAKLEQQLNQLPGAVCNGLFALRKVDTLLLAKSAGLETITV